MSGLVFCGWFVGLIVVIVGMIFGWVVLFCIRIGVVVVVGIGEVIFGVGVVLMVYVIEERRDKFNKFVIIMCMILFLRECFIKWFNINLMINFCF